VEAFKPTQGCGWHRKELNVEVIKPTWGHGVAQESEESGGGQAYTGLVSGPRNDKDLEAIKPTKRRKPH
jgi:hypothetical protein